MSVRCVCVCMCEWVRVNVCVCACQGPVRGVGVWWPCLLYRIKRVAAPCPALLCGAVVMGSSLPYCPISGYTLSSFCHVIVSRGPAAAALPRPSPAGVQCSAYAVMSSSLVLGDCAITWTMNKAAKKVQVLYYPLMEGCVAAGVVFTTSTAQGCAETTARWCQCLWPNIFTGCPPTAVTSALS